MIYTQILFYKVDWINILLWPIVIIFCLWSCVPEHSFKELVTVHPRNQHQCLRHVLFNNNDRATWKGYYFAKTFSNILYGLTLTLYMGTWIDLATIEGAAGYFLHLLTLTSIQDHWKFKNFKNRVLSRTNLNTEFSSGEHKSPLTSLLLSFLVFTIICL